MPWSRFARAIRRWLARPLVWILRKTFFSTRTGRRVFAWLVSTAPARMALVASFVVADERQQRWFVRRMLAQMTPAAQKNLAASVLAWARRSGSARLFAAHDLILAYAPGLIGSWAAFADEAGRTRPAKSPFAIAIAAYELAKYKDAVAAFVRVRDADPSSLCDGYNYAKAAYAAGKIRKADLAMEFFARQFGICSGPNPFDDGDRKSFLGQVYCRVNMAIMRMIARRNAAQDGGARNAVFFLSSTEALGHAILDPYHFLALRRENYGRVVFVGPPRERYRAASAVCLEIVEQYGDYVEVDDDLLLNLSWMSMGTISSGTLDMRFVGDGQDQAIVQSRFQPIDIVIEHYWSLLREAVHRTGDEGDAFRHNAWHMRLPAAFEDNGRAFCRRHGIDPATPIVVVHARDHGYHKLEKQDFRNADVTNYLPALKYLLDAGYQVIRIGDRHMQRLEIASGGFHELPFMDGYDHRLDPFFIARSRFMIGCQSGPCSYARALGIPLLSINAVLHYTLLPAAKEMACFKRYIREEASGPREIRLLDALAAGVYHFDNTYQFRQAGIRTEDASAEEIVAAVKDMIAWLDTPDLPETPQQAAFREAVAQVAAGLKSKGPTLDLPIGDFIGIALPGYRIAPSVAAMRADREAGPQACRTA